MLTACNNKKNLIRFAHSIQQDASPQNLWIPDCGEKEEEIVKDVDASIEDIVDGGNLEPSTLEACNNSCYAMYGECHNSESCDKLVGCMTDCGTAFFPQDAQ